MTERARSDGRAGLAIASEPPNPGSETDTAEMSVGISAITGWNDRHESGQPWMKTTSVVSPAPERAYSMRAPPASWIVASVNVREEVGVVRMAGLSVLDVFEDQGVSRGRTMSGSRGACSG